MKSIADQLNCRHGCMFDGTYSNEFTSPHALLSIGNICKSHQDLKPFAEDVEGFFRRAQALVIRTYVSEKLCIFASGSSGAVFTKSSGDGFVTDILTSERKDSEFRERHVLYNSSLVPSPTPSFSSLLSTLYRTKQRRKAGRGTGNEASIIPVS